MSFYECIKKITAQNKDNAQSRAIEIAKNLIKAKAEQGSSILTLFDSDFSSYRLHLPDCREHIIEFFREEGFKVSTYGGYYSTIIISWSITND